MSHTILTWVLAAGAAQGLFLAMAILTRRSRNPAASRWLALLMALLAVMLFGELLDLSAVMPDLALGLAVEFAVPPTLFLFVSAVLAPHPPTRRAALVHFVPTVVAIVILVALHRLSAGPSLGIAHPQLGRAVVLLVVLKFVNVLVYAVAIWRVLRDATAQSSWRQGARIRRYRLWLLVALTGVCVAYASLMLQIAGVTLLADADTVGALLSVAAVFAFGFIALQQPVVLSQLHRNDAAATPSRDRDMVDIDGAMATERPYLDPDFSLSAWSANRGLALHTVRDAIEQRHRMSARDYVNNQRLAAFEALARDAKNRHRTTLELALAAGFGSKATFYRVFRAARRQSPAAFRAGLAARD